MIEGELESGSSSDQSLSITGCDSKMIAEKCDGYELGEEDELPRKRVRVRDLKSVMLSSCINTHNPDSQRNKEVGDQLQGGGEVMPRTSEALVAVDMGGTDQLEGGAKDVTKSTEVLVSADMDEINQLQKSELEISKVNKAIVTVVSDATGLGKSGGNISAVMVKPIPMELDLNTNIGVANNTVDNDGPVSADNFGKLSLTGEHGSAYGNKVVASIGTGLDLNTENIASSGEQDSFHLFKSYNQLKASEASECGSTTGSQEDNESMRIWQQMKQNGFQSSSLRGIQIPMPKQRGRRSKGDTNKKKRDSVKKEQVQRRNNIAAPSGLLNDLNPGIINHVRNKKQVHSIIEALVQSEKRENNHLQGKQTSHMNLGNKEIGHRKNLDNLNELGAERRLFSHQDSHLHFLTGERQSKAYTKSMGKSLAFMSENTGGDGNSSMRHRFSGGHPLPLREDDTLALKLTSANKGHEKFSSLSHEESANLSCVSSLAVKAANVASQWLELLHQDIKGRLAALRRTKKRVRDVITTNLPRLISQEIPSNQENDPGPLKSSADVFSSNSIAEMHKAKWSGLFNQMDQSLAEEERELENWLFQVRDMQRRCEQGLQQFPWTMPYGFQQSGASENDSGSSVMDRFEKELPVRAAAASIYSTCNFLSSGENVSRC